MQFIKNKLNCITYLFTFVLKIKETSTFHIMTTF